jgi:type IV secretion system protein VirD4
MDVINLLFRMLIFVSFNLVKAILIGSLALVRGLFWLFRKLLRGRSISHGSARWASLWELRNAFGGNGIVLGKKFGRFIRFKSEGHVLVVASARGGKTAGICVPSILEAKGSVIAVDPKAELYDLTHADRAKKGPVFRLDLIDVETSDYFNPLDLIRVGTIHEPDDALALAELMVDDATENASHWDYKAREVLAALMIFVKRRYGEREAERCTLWKIKSLTSLGLTGLVAELEDADTLGSETLAGVVRALRGSNESPEAFSIISNTDKALLLYGSDRPAGTITRWSDFSMGVFRRELASLYLIVPADKLAVQGPFLRLMLGCALMMQTREQSIVPEHKTLFVIDEAGVIGGIPEIATGVAVSAAIARILLIFQDLGQIDRNYGKLARSIIANAGAFVCFAVRDIETATTISRSLGDKTETTISDGMSQSSTALLRHQVQSGRAESGRALLDPSEIIRLKPHQAIVFMNTVRYPIRLSKIRFWKVWRYRGRFGQWRGYRKQLNGTARGWMRTEP